MKVLITGAFGMIGRELIKELEDAGDELRLLDRLRPEDATCFVPGQTERAKMPVETHWPWLEGDILDIPTVAKAVAGMDAVVNLAAAVTGLPEFGPDTMRLNVVGTYIVLDEARKAGVKRCLCASSINAFGTFYWRLSGRPPVYTKMPLDETFHPVPEDSYSLGKLCNELTCEAFNRAFGITTAAFRFAAVGGEEWYQNFRKDGIQPTKEWSDDLYQWVHVKDIVAGICRALEFADLPGHGVYTLSAPDTRCPEPTMELLAKFRPDLARTVDPPLKGREPLLSISRAQKAFGYSPKHRLID